VTVQQRNILHVALSIAHDEIGGNRHLENEEKGKSLTLLLTELKLKWLLREVALLLASCYL